MKMVYKVLLIILFLIISGYLLFFFTAKNNKEMENVVLRYYFSVQGRENVMTLFKDRTFIEKKSFLDSRKTCNTGTVSQEGYNIFLSYLEKTNFITKKIHQKSDSSVLCEGFSTLTLNINNSINSIESPCVQEYSSETKEVFVLIDEIEKRFENLLKKSDRFSCNENTI